MITEARENTLDDARETAYASGTDVYFVAPDAYETPAVWSVGADGGDPRLVLARIDVLGGEAAWQAVTGHLPKVTV